MYKKIKEELIKSFKNTSQPLYKIEGSNICWECEERHLELDNGREVTLDDIAISCYSYIFYEESSFVFLIPRLLIKAMNKKSDIHDTFPEFFLEELRREEKLNWFLGFSKERKEVIIKALEFIYNLYYMDEYHVWDFDKEELIYYYKEEKLEKEVKLTLNYWRFDVL